MASESKYKDLGWTSSPYFHRTTRTQATEQIDKALSFDFGPSISVIIKEENKRSATAYENPKTISYGALANWIPHLDTRLDRNNCTTLLRMSDFSLSIA